MTMNAHPNLATVQIYNSDQHLILLARFPSATAPLFSKFLINSAVLDDTRLRHLARSPTAHLFHTGGLGIKPLQLYGTETLEQGPGGLHFRGLEVLQLEMSRGSLSWLFPFVQSQPDLARIEFYGTSAPWSSTIYIPYGAQIRTALIAEGFWHWKLYPFRAALLQRNRSTIGRSPLLTCISSHPSSMCCLWLTNSVSSLVLRFQQDTRRKLPNIHMMILSTFWPDFGPFEA
ncbi:hypothetical protein C8J56DRAFT_965171 [Mycena floridula]|nr:hypothetical protein C8J56DRAFT_965171 [Mycena floridula]